MIKTPIEEYPVKGKTVYVKRDDLIGDGELFPRWAKIGGIRTLLEDTQVIQKDRPLVHFSARQSWTGWVLSRLCNEYGIPFISAYGDSKVFPQKLKDKVIENGGELLPLKTHMPSILRNRVKGLARDNNWQLLPYGFEHKNYTTYMRKRMEEVVEEHEFDHLVISSGSGVTMVGLTNGFLKSESVFDMFANKKQVHTALTSSRKSVYRVLSRNDVNVENVNFYETPFDFGDPMSDYKVPFDCNEYWDKKSWWWLEQNIEKLEGKILFWNLGGNFEKSIGGKECVV